MKLPKILREIIVRFTVNDDPDDKASVKVNGEVVGDITRCKDCKHFGTDPKWPICSEHDVETDPDYFCSWAERKEDDYN